MDINLDIDPALLTLAIEAGGFKTTQETINQALQEFILRRRQQEIKEWFGKIEYDVDYDYKSMRNR
jgi:hypothetical protein